MESTIRFLRVETMKRLFIYILLVSLSFSSLIWQTGAGGEVVTKPVVFGGNVVVGALDGDVYSLDPSAGTISWRATLGTDFVDFTLFDGGLIAATTGGDIAKIKTDGSKQWEISLSGLNVTYIYGIDSNSKNIYVSASNGIYEVSKGGTPTLLYEIEEGTTLTPPKAGEGYLLFGAGNKLIKIDDDGRKQWEREIDNHNFWLSRPVAGDASVFVGALDNRLHVYHLTGGYERWNYLTDGWILSTPLFDGSTVYFGSNDGYVYAVDANSGGLRWKTELPLAVVSEPEKGLMGGVESVFVGCTDGSIYALDAGDGNIIWKGSAAGMVGSPLYYNKQIIFGSADALVYAYTTERACSIESPKEGEYVGRKEVVIRGRSVSEAGSQTVQVDINDFGWTSTTTESDGSWELITDPSQDLVEGLNTISCRVVDSAGEETGTSFTTVSIVRDSTIPLDDFVVTQSTDTPIEGTPFTIYVNSKSDGSPVDRFELAIDGEAYTGDRNVSVTLAEGTYSATVSKIGYNDKGFTVNVQSAGIPMWQIAVVVVLVLVLLGTIYRKVVKKK
jgi:outer membrane protein assembly factor BamB